MRKGSGWSSNMEREVKLLFFEMMGGSAWDLHVRAVKKAKRDRYDRYCVVQGCLSCGMPVGDGEENVFCGGICELAAYDMSSASYRTAWYDNTQKKRRPRSKTSVRNYKVGKS